MQNQSSHLAPRDESSRGASELHSLNGSYWQLAAAGVLLVVWTLFLLMMAIVG